MKKLILSIGVVLTFIAYSFQQRGEGTGQVIAPSTTTSSPTATTQPAVSTGGSTQTTTTYKDGSYTGQPADAYYGYVQIKVAISGGRIIDVQFLQYPNDQSTSRMINHQAMPYLQQEVIQAQNANVNVISGATDTSMAFIQSLTSALNQAQA